MEVVRARRKLEVLEVVRVDPKQVAAVAEWLRGFGVDASHVVAPVEVGGLVSAPVDQIVVVDALAGERQLLGGWVARDASGRFLFLSDDDYAAEFETVDPVERHRIVVGSGGWQLEHPAGCVARDLECSVYAAAVAAVRADGRLPVAPGRRVVDVSAGGVLVWGPDLG